MEIKGSETEKNLLKAFEIEAKRRTEYDIYALIAKRQGFDDISRLLTMFADHEKEHAKLWHKWINYGKTPTLIESLEKALEDEKNSIEGLYEGFAKTAKEEGIEHIAGLFENIENIEKIHYERLRNVILKLKDDAKPNPDGTFNWACSVCGGVFVQKEEPDYCPLCVKEDVFFYKKAD